MNSLTAFHRAVFRGNSASRRHLHVHHPLRSAKLENVLGDDFASRTLVRGMSSTGIELADGLVLPSACIFLNGQVFLWQIPGAPWRGWSKEQFEVFDAVIPKPELLILGTGTRTFPPPASIRSYLENLGIPLDIMDTRNACSTYNLLLEEGRRVAAALIPPTAKPWTLRQRP